MAEPPVWIASAPFSAATRLLLTWMWVLASEAGGVAWVAMTQVALGRLTDQSERSIRRQLAQLEQLGHVVMTRRGGDRGFELRRNPDAPVRIGHARPGAETGSHDPDRTPRSGAETGSQRPNRTQPEGFGPRDPDRSPVSGPDRAVRVPKPDRGVRTGSQRPVPKPDPSVRTGSQRPENRTGASGSGGGKGGALDPVVLSLSSPARSLRHDAQLEVDRLKEWRRFGGDPDGLGAWPSVQQGDRVREPITMPVGKILELADAGVTAIEMHRTVHRLAAAIESGGFKVEGTPDPWRGVYVFSGHFEALREAVDRHLAARDRKQREAEDAQREREKTERQRDAEREGFKAVGELIDRSGNMGRLLAMARGEEPQRDDTNGQD